MGFVFAALSGLLAALSYPTVLFGHRLPDLGFVAFFCWVFLFRTLSSASPRRAFALAFVAGLFHYGLSMYWLYTAMHSFGHMSPAASVGALCLLVAFLSAYFGVIFFLSQWISLRCGISVAWVRPWVWLAVEFLRNYGPMGGFPWSQVGYSQGGFLHFIQIADVAGVYGVTWLVVVINEALALVVAKFGDRRQRVAVPVGLGIVLFGAALYYGHLRLDGAAAPRPQRILKVGVVQGNIPQDEKWDPDQAESILQIYREETRKLDGQGVDLVLWPESALPDEVILSRPAGPRMPQQPLGEVAADLGVRGDASLLLGAVTLPVGAAHPSGLSLPSRQRVLYNSALWLKAQSPSADRFWIWGAYHKRHLVPFGEYIPWKRWLFFAKKLTAQLGELFPGDGYRPLQLGDATIGIPICYEDVFPEIAREMVKQKAQALVNLTNDAWYGYSSAPYQHQVFSQFRSVETRRALVRATNTGLSSMIERDGRIRWQGELFKRQSFIGELPLYSELSFYVRFGDVLPKLAGGAAVLFCLLAAMKGRKGQRRARAEG